MTQIPKKGFLQLLMFAIPNRFWIRLNLTLSSQSFIGILFQRLHTKISSVTIAVNAVNHAPNMT